MSTGTQRCYSASQAHSPVVSREKGKKKGNAAGGKCTCRWAVGSWRGGGGFRVPCSCPHAHAAVSLSGGWTVPSRAHPHVAFFKIPAVRAGGPGPGSGCRHDTTVLPRSLGVLARTGRTCRRPPCPRRVFGYYAWLGVVWHGVDLTRSGAAPAR